MYTCGIDTGTDADIMGRSMVFEALVKPDTMNFSAAWYTLPIRSLMTISQIVNAIAPRMRM
jgi:hypothetical protein